MIISCPVTETEQQIQRKKIIITVHIIHFSLKQEIKVFLKCKYRIEVE